MDIQEQEVIKNIKSGDESGLRLLFDLYYSPLCLFAYKYFDSYDKAEDIVQEVFMRLWSRRERLNEYRSIEAFAMTMTKNYCLDQLKAKRSNNLSLVHSNYKDNNISLQREIELKDSVNRVHELIENLPEKQKMIIQLREMHFMYLRKRNYKLHLTKEVLNLRLKLKDS